MSDKENISKDTSELKNRSRRTDVVSASSQYSQISGVESTDESIRNIHKSN